MSLSIRNLLNLTSCLIILFCPKSVTYYTREEVTPAMMDEALETVSSKIGPGECMSMRNYVSATMHFDRLEPGQTVSMNDGVVVAPPHFRHEENGWVWPWWRRVQILKPAKTTSVEEIILHRHVGIEPCSLPVQKGKTL